MEVPRLIEQHAGIYLSQTLKNCHEKKLETYSFIMNVVITVFFVAITVIILYLLFQKKKTPDQLKTQLLHDQKFILEKIKALKEQKQHYLGNEMISKIPMPELNTNTHANLFY